MARFRIALATGLALVGLAVCFVAAGAPAAAQSACSPQLPNASSCSLDVWAGRAEWTPFSADAPDVVFSDQVEWAFGVDNCPRIENGTINRTIGSSFFFADGGVGLSSDNASTGILLHTGQLNVMRNGSAAHLNLRLGADWNYAGPPSGNLTWIAARTDGSLSCFDSGVNVTVHNRIESDPPARAWFGDDQTFGDGTWVLPAEVVHVRAGPFVYSGTNHTVVAQLHLTMKIDDTPDLHAVPSPFNTAEWQWSYPHESASAVYEFEVRAGATDPPQFIQYVGSWGEGVDAEPPTGSAIYPVGASAFTTATDAAQVAVHACDNGSGIATEAPELGYDGPLVAMTGSVAVSWYRSTDDRCVDGLLALPASAGNSIVVLHLLDRLAHRGDVLVNITRQAPSAVLGFDAFSPINWSRTRSVPLSVHIVVPAGLTVDPATVWVSVTDSMAGDPAWTRDGVTFDPASATASAAFTARRDAFFFVRWRASTFAVAGTPPPEVGGESSIQAVGVDTLPPHFDLEPACGPPGAAPPAYLDYDISDRLSGVDPAATELVVALESGGTTSYAAATVLALNATAVRLTFLPAVPPGLSRLSVVAFDRAGNNATSSPCEVSVDRPVSLLAGPGGPLLVVLVLIAAAAVAVAALRQRASHAREDAPGDRPDP